MIRSKLCALSLSLKLLVAGIIFIGWVAPNVKTTFNQDIDVPVIARTARIHPLAAVNGSVIIGEHISVAPGASIRGDEGEHIFIGDDSNVQDGVVVHGLETFKGGHDMN